MSKWDWIHAGLEVATYAQAQKAQKNLAEMKTASEIERAHRMLLEAMRSFVFDISRDIQLAEEQITSAPQQVYIVSKLLDSRFASSGLSADIFPDFQDKEYVFKTQKMVTEVTRKSKTFLTKEQIEQSDTAVQYILEMPMIQKAIPSKVAQEYLQESDERWQELENINQYKGFSSTTSLALIVISLFVGFITGTFLGLLIAFVGIVTAIFLLIPKNKESSLDHEYELLKDKREELKKQLTPQEDWEKILATIGDLSSSQLKKIFEERFEFLRKVLGDEIQKYLTSEK